MTTSAFESMDATSLLAEVDGATTLDALETELAARGLTLRVPLDGGRGAKTVAAWIAEGAPGAPNAFFDPADHLLAGADMTLANGDRLTIRPAPRRAVGPDLLALVIGGGGRFATLDRAWLRVHRRDARVVREPLPAGVDLDPPPNEDERRILDAIARELTAPPGPSPR